MGATHISTRQPVLTRPHAGQRSRKRRIAASRAVHGRRERVHNGAVFGSPAQRLSQPSRAPALRIGDLYVGPFALAGVVLLGLAAIPMLVGPPSWITLILAGVATLLLALDRHFGWLPAGLVALIALPYGRGANVLQLSIGDWPIRPPDVIIAVAVFGALTQLPRHWRWGVRREPLLLGAFGAFALLGLVAVTRMLLTRLATTRGSQRITHTIPGLVDARTQLVSTP